jgi:hypothetical protein
MVLLASAFDQSKFMNAGDFPQEKALRIKGVTVETMPSRSSGQEQKPVLWFTNHKKGLVLNKTNNRTIRGAYGDDMETWAGKIVVVYPTQAEMGGKLVPALRVRIPPPKQAVAGNGQPSKSKGAEEALKTFAAPPVQEVLPPEPKPSLEDDLDDEINF